MTLEASEDRLGDQAIEPLLVKLTTNQLAIRWPSLSDGILKGMRVESKDDVEVVKARLLQSLLRRYLECWVIVDRRNQKKLLGVLTTLFSGDMYVGEKSLIIYSLYRWERVEHQLWESAISTLLKYAKAKNCNRVVAYTELDSVVKLATSLGARGKTTLLEWEV